MTATEYVILVDESDNILGTAPKLYAHQHGLLHRAFSIFVYRINNHQQIEWLLQQRAFHKYHSPGLWTNTCCSHPNLDETTLNAAMRRLQEEMGFVVPLMPCGQFQYKANVDNALIEHEVDHVFVGYANNDCFIQANPNEVAHYRWIETQMLQTELALQPTHFTPWFEAAFKIAQASLKAE